MSEESEHGESETHPDIRVRKGNGQISGELLNKKMQMLVILDAHLLQLGRYLFLFITKCEKKNT